MNDEQDLAAEDEMISEGAPSEPDPEERYSALQAELAEAKQSILYAQAETQNVRRRLEKDGALVHHISLRSSVMAEDFGWAGDRLTRRIDGTTPGDGAVDAVVP